MPPARMNSGNYQHQAVAVNATIHSIDNLMARQSDDGIVPDAVNSQRWKEGTMYGVQNGSHLRGSGVAPLLFSPASFIPLPMASLLVRRVPGSTYQT